MQIADVEGVQALKDVFQVVFTDGLALGEDGKELDLRAGLIPVHSKLFDGTEMAQEHVVGRISAAGGGGCRGRGRGWPAGHGFAAFVKGVEGAVGEEMEAEGIVIASVEVGGGKEGLQVEELVLLANHGHAGNHVFVPCVFVGWGTCVCVLVGRRREARMKNTNGEHDIFSSPQLLFAEHFLTFSAGHFLGAKTRG